MSTTAASPPLPESLSVRSLRQRGWSTDLINDLLGRSEFKKKDQEGKPEVGHYPTTTVLAHEVGERFVREKLSRRERTEQRDEEWRRRNSEELMPYSELLHVRGWTREQIRALLGGPDALKRFKNATCPGEVMVPVLMYRAARVRIMELRHRIVAQKQDTPELRAERRASRTELLQAAARAVISLPEGGELRLHRLVAQWDEDLRGGLFMARSAERRAHLCVQYLCLTCTPVTEGLDENTPPRPGKTAARLLLTKRLYLAVREKYPSLGAACEQQFERLGLGPLDWQGETLMLNKEGGAEREEAVAAQRPPQIVPSAARG